MSKLFEKILINKMQIKNRFVRSATWEGMASSDGYATPQLIETMKALAEGEVGLIISSHAYIRPEGQAGKWQLGIYTDEQIPKLGEMTSSVHPAGAKIIAQLAHSGTQADEKITGTTPMAVSLFDGLADSPRKEFSTDDLHELVNAYTEAAVRAKKAGFDGVQIHSAHGYLLSQFLSPYFNRRTDDYGGSIENRTKIHVKILKAIRAATGHDYPILMKLNCEDFSENGLSSDDALKAAEIFAHAGLDALELSGGILTNNSKLSPSRTGIKAEDNEAYFRDAARLFKEKLNIPLILVGGIRSFSVAENVVENNIADMISLSRPLIREPDLIKRWQSGDLRPAECNSDNLCFKPAKKGQGIYCLSREREQQQK